MPNLDKLIKFLETEGKMELSESFKTQLSDVFAVALSEKTAEIEKLKKETGEKEKKIGEKDVEIDELKKSKKKETEEEEAEEKKEKEEKIKEAVDVIINKVDSFLESELSELIPDNLIEAQAKMEIYEPIVEGFKATMASYGIKMEGEGIELLKAAKTEIESLQETVNTKVADYETLEEASAKLLAKVVLNEKCEGLTPAQSEKVKVVFAGKSVDEINEKFETIRNLIIDEKVSTEVVKPVAVVTESVVTESVKTPIVEDLGQKYL